MENEITPDDELKAENELLKLKLEIEHGMTDMDAKTLLPEGENQWLNYIYNFEKQYKDAGRIKVVEFIGNPVYKKVDELDASDVSQELKRLQEIMADNGIEIGFICDYSDEVKYKFITEELFDEETDNIRIDGMMSCFTYEEFHPNHDYDLRRHSEDFLRQIFERTWTEDNAKYEMTKMIRFQGKEYDGRGISQVILAFQEAASKFEIKQKKVMDVAFDIDKFKGYVEIAISYTQYWKDGNVSDFVGDCHLHFRTEYGGWSISEFSLPGLGS